MVHFKTLIILEELSIDRKWIEDIHQVCVYVKFFNHCMILVIVANRTTNVEFVLACIMEIHTIATLWWFGIMSPILSMKYRQDYYFLRDLNDIMCDMDSTSINANKCRMCSYNSFVKQCCLFYWSLVARLTRGRKAFFFHSDQFFRENEVAHSQSSWRHDPCNIS